jgi:hypothetical protein
MPGDRWKQAGSQEDATAFGSRPPGFTVSHNIFTQKHYKTVTKALQNNKLPS